MYIIFFINIARGINIKLGEKTQTAVVQINKKSYNYNVFLNIMTYNLIHSKPVVSYEIGR